MKSSVPHRTIGVSTDIILPIFYSLTAVLPLAMNHQTLMIFEPAKFYLLGFGMIGIGIGIGIVSLRHLTLSFITWRELIRQYPIPIILVLVNLIWTLVSVLLSISPGESWWGNINRYHGGASGMMMAGIFMVSLVITRDPDRRDHILELIILGSIPIIIYALWQAAGFDIRIWLDRPAGRVSSTLGNPIFLGSYLIFPFFMSLYRMIQIDNWRDRRWMGSLTACGLTVTALVLTGSRGPMLGWLVGVGVLGLLYGHTRLSWIRCRLWIRVIITVIIPAGIAAGLFLWPQIGEIGSRSGTIEVRRIMRQSAAQALLQPPVFTDTRGIPDPLTRYRNWIGYGPDALQHLYPIIYPTELEDYEIPLRMSDRLHSPLLDAVFRSGFPAMILELLLWAFFLLAGLKTLCIISRSGMIRLSFILAGLTLVGLSLFPILKYPWLITSIPYQYLALYGIMIIQSKPAPKFFRHQALHIVLTACLIGFYMGIQFSFASLSETALAYILLALWLHTLPNFRAAQPSFHPDSDRPSFTEKSPTADIRPRPWIGLLALITAILLFIPPLRFHPELKYSTLWITVSMAAGAAAWYRLMYPAVSWRNGLIPKQIIPGLIRITPWLITGLIYYLLSFRPEILMTDTGIWILSSLGLWWLIAVTTTSDEFQSSPRRWVFVVIWIITALPLTGHMIQETRLWLGQSLYHQNLFQHAVPYLKPVSLITLAEKSNQYHCESLNRINSDQSRIEALRQAGQFRLGHPYSRMAYIYQADLYWKQGYMQ
ncbi:MAG: hypothetical protein KBA26_13970, partial [Candidatus Delongbacteria bacterium]|nr:hypothetical protein [Candidatus Delongbacteria bacterium]